MCNSCSHCMAITQPFLIHCCNSHGSWISDVCGLLEKKWVGSVQGRKDSSLYHDNLWREVTIKLMHIEKCQYISRFIVILDDKNGISLSIYTENAFDKIKMDSNSKSQSH